MPEKVPVECGCGYTVYAAQADIGSTVECMNCGAELHVTPPASAPEETASAPTSDAALDQPVKTAARAPETPSTGSRSPFEDDEDPEPSPIAEASNADVPAPEESTTPVSFQSESARSPFQNDEPDEDDQAPSGPFSLDAAPESKDASFASLMEAERPKADPRNDRVETESPLDVQTGETCSECGRAIRGQWDRFAFEEGVLCYICSNQATHGIPKRMQTEKGQRELTENDFLIEKRAPLEPEPAPWYFDPQSDTFKRVLLVLAFGTVGIALYVSFFNVSPPPEAMSQDRIQAMEDAVAGEEIVLPLWANIVIWSWRAFGMYLGFLITLYFVLERSNGLPRDTWKENILYICFVLSIVAGIQALSSFAYLVLMPIFVVGGFLYVLVWAISGFAQIMIVNGMLDLRFSDWMWAFLVYFPLSQILLQSVGLFLHAGIYQLVS